MVLGVDHREVGMPTAALHPCSASALCPHLTSEAQPCPVHGSKSRQKRQRRIDREKLYSLAKWRHPVWGLRAQVLRDQPFCVDCIKAGQPYILATDVDHIIPHRGNLTLFMERKNLQPLCSTHHQAKTQRENGGG